MAIHSYDSRQLKKEHIAVMLDVMDGNPTAVRHHMSYGITQCYLPPDTIEVARVNPSVLAGARVG